MRELVESAIVKSLSEESQSIEIACPNDAMRRRVSEILEPACVRWSTMVEHGPVVYTGKHDCGTEWKIRVRMMTDAEVDAVIRGQPGGLH